MTGGIRPGLSREERLGLRSTSPATVSGGADQVANVRWWHLGGPTSRSRRHLLGPQLMFCGVLLAAVVILVWVGPKAKPTAMVWVGLAIAVVATVCALVLPWSRLAPQWGAILPLLDLAALGLSRSGMQPEGRTLSFFVVVVALWLVTILRTTGVVLATIATILMISLPAIYVEVDEVTVVQVVRYTLPPLAVLLLSWLVLDLYERLESTSERLRANLDEQQAMHAQIEQRARLIGAVGDSLNIGLLVLDVDGNDVMWNDAQLEIHALVSPPENDDRTESGHLIFGVDRRTPLPPDQRAVYRAAHGEIFENMLVYAGPPGPKQRALSASALQVLNDDGVHEATVIVFFDVTEMQSLMREREQFVATVSHELRTPLTSIIGYADLALEEAQNDSEGQMYLGIIERNARQLLTLVEDLLQQQQIRISAHDRQLEPCDISELAVEAVESLQPEAQRKAQSLTAKTSSTPITALERPRILQVLDNLITNALKYTPEGGSIVVSTSADAGSLNFAVSDDGPGLDPAEAAQMFAPFFRTKSAHSSGVSGAGLGLGLCRTIVEAHNGHIAVDTAPGHGTAIRVSIPFSKSGSAHV